MSDIVYLGISGWRAIAGPVVLSLVYFKQAVESKLFSLYLSRSWRNYDHAAIKDELRRLQDCWHDTTVYLPPNYINQHGMTDSLERLTRKAVINLFVETGLKQSNTLIKVSQLAFPRSSALMYRDVHKSVRSFAAQQISFLHYRYHIEQYHQSYPMYQWDVNSGMPTDEHYKLLMDYGPSPYHYKESVKTIARWFYRKVSELSVIESGRCKNLAKLVVPRLAYLSSPPPWWNSRRYGDYHACLTADQISTIGEMTRQIMSRRHRFFLLKAYGKIKPM